MGMRFFKNIYLFFTFRSKIIKNENDLKSLYNIRLDNIYRLYTVLNIPENLIEEPYNLRKSDIDSLSKKYIEEYIISFSQYLNSKGLTELYKLYDLQKVDKYSYLIVFGYSLFNTKRFANNLLYTWALSVLLLMIILIVSIFI